MGSGKGQAKRIKTNDTSVTTWLTENNINIEEDDRSNHVMDLEINGIKRQYTIRRRWSGELEIKDSRIVKYNINKDDVVNYWNNMDVIATYLKPEAKDILQKEIINYYQYKIDRSQWIKDCNNNVIGCNDSNMSLVKFYLGANIKTQDLSLNDMSYIYTQLMYDLFNNAGITFSAGPWKEKDLGLSFNLKEFTIENYRIEINPEIMHGIYYKKYDRLSLVKNTFAFLINQEKEDSILAVNSFNKYNAIKGGSKMRGNLHSSRNDPLYFIKNLWEEFRLSNKLFLAEEEKQKNNIK